MNFVYYVRMLTLFLRVSIQEEMAYRANFFISLLQSLLDLLHPLSSSLHDATILPRPLN